MRIEYMREFLAIHDEGNFSRAARSLFMAQPALSRHVQELERELGVKLLDRDKHSVRLTEAGERAYKGFRQILRNYERLTDDIASYKGGLVGNLRIGMLYYTIRQDFGDAMERFSAEYPGVRLRRFSYQPQEVFQALAEELGLKIVTPMDVYGALAVRYSKLAIIAANSQALAAQHGVMTRANPRILTMCADLLPVVLDIEARYTPEEIVRRNHLDTLMTYFEQIECEALLLGCTHFPYIKDALSACFSRPIIDPAEEMVKLLRA